MQFDLDWIMLAPELSPLEPELKFQINGSDDHPDLETGKIITFPLPAPFILQFELVLTNVSYVGFDCAEVKCTG
jgi:hypothetical protein